MRPVRWPWQRKHDSSLDQERSDALAAIKQTEEARQEVDRLRVESTQVSRGFKQLRQRNKFADSMFRVIREAQR